MEHIVQFNAGYDCTRFECKFEKKDCIPGEGGWHGVHGLIILFVSKGEKGAVLFVLYTGWLPQLVRKNNIGYRYVEDWNDVNGIQLDPKPFELSYHARAPQYEGQEAREDCPFLDGTPCYYAGSGLKAADAMYALVNGGDKALWEFLDAYYETVFNNANYPHPAEYCKPPRKQAKQFIAVYAEEES